MYNEWSTTTSGPVPYRILNLDFLPLVNSAKYYLKITKFLLFIYIKVNISLNFFYDFLNTISLIISENLQNTLKMPHLSINLL